MGEVKLWLPPNMDPLEKYRTTHNEEIHDSDFGGGGFMSVKVLPELINCKLDMVAISLLKSLGARSVRVTGGECTTDSSPGRATIIVDENDIIQSITMEVSFQAPRGEEPMCGVDMNAKLRSLRVSKTRKKLKA